MHTKPRWNQELMWGIKYECGIVEFQSISHLIHFNHQNMNFTLVSMNSIIESFETQIICKIRILNLYHLMKKDITIVDIHRVPQMKSIPHYLT